jgi:hypothetical protein
LTPEDRLRLDYEQTTDLLRLLTDVRFKLLALVPTISGAAVAIIGRGASAAELMAVGALGLVATIGIFLYELRNTRLYDEAARRAQLLESKLGLDERVRAAGDTGLLLVYSAALGGWVYLTAWGALRALDVGSAQRAGGAIAVAAALLVLAIEKGKELRWNGSTKPTESSAAEV